MHEARTGGRERLDQEVKPRTDVVGVVPNAAALLRLAGAVLVEAHDQWQVPDCRYLSEGSMALPQPVAQVHDSRRRRHCVGMPWLGRDVPDGRTTRIAGSPAPSAGPR